MRVDEDEQEDRDDRCCVGGGFVGLLSLLVGERFQFHSCSRCGNL